MGPAKGWRMSLLTLSLEELECIQDQCRKLAESAKVRASVFTLDEMQIIRDQYEARLAAEAQRREDLEWRLEVALAQLRASEPADDADDRPLRLADATPPHGFRMATPTRKLPPPLPVRPRLGSDAAPASLPAPVDLAPLRDALLRVAGRRASA
jgi:hypothetical protein